MDRHSEYKGSEYREYRSGHGGSAVEGGGWRRGDASGAHRQDDQHHPRHASRHEQNRYAEHNGYQYRKREEHYYRDEERYREDYQRGEEGDWQGYYQGDRGNLQGGYKGDEADYRGYYEDYYREQDQRYYSGEGQGTESGSPSQLRLVKLSSDVLSDEQKVAIVDGRGEGVSIGRDRSFTARIRCPSMEVSKHHANIFRLSKDERGHRSHHVTFAVADTGSTHGTFLLLDPPPSLTSESLPPVTAYQRLSEPKKASAPTNLRHMSLLRVGQTVFQAHLHSGWTTSCQECALSEDGSNEIELVVKDKKETKPSAAVAVKETGAQRKSEAKVAPKQAIRELKSRHLGEAPSTLPTESDVPQYVDRAAARRARGGVQTTAPVPVSSLPPPTRAGPAPVAATSEPAAKLDASNRGYQMFASMTSKGGETSQASHDPILARGVEGRAGLGSKRLLDVQEMASRLQHPSPNDMRERQRRRFEEAS